jgi:IclR family acetate operon transcriptional repressor
VARIQSIARAKAILEVLSAGDGNWVSLRDIAAGTGLAKTTAFSLTMALVEVGLVEHDPAHGAYRLGVELIAYGRAVERRTDLIGLLRPYLVKLCATTRETVNLALPCPTDVLSVDGSEAMRRQVLALQPLVPLTPHTSVDPARIDAVLAECRRRGFVEEIEENEEGAACVGAALLDGKGDAIAAVSIAGPLTRMGQETRESVGRLLVETLAEARRTLLASSHRSRAS